MKIVTTAFHETHVVDNQTIFGRKIHRNRLHLTYTISMERFPEIVVHLANKTPKRKCTQHELKIINSRQVINMIKSLIAYQDKIDEFQLSQRRQMCDM